MHKIQFRSFLKFDILLFIYLKLGPELQIRNCTLAFEKFCNGISWPYELFPWLPVLAIFLRKMENLFIRLLNVKSFEFKHKM